MELGAHDMFTDGPGEAATGNGSNAGAHAIAASECAADGAAVDSSGGAGAEVADEGGASWIATHDADGIGGGATASNAPATASKRRKRSRSNRGRPNAAHDRRRVAALDATCAALRQASDAQRPGPNGL